MADHQVREQRRCSKCCLAPAISPVRQVTVLTTLILRCFADRKGVPEAEGCEPGVCYLHRSTSITANSAIANLFQAQPETM